MPSWGELLEELQATVSVAGGPPDFDAVRRKYIARLADHTGRNTMVYASDFLAASGPEVAINLADKQGLMEVFRGLSGKELDIVLHSPGGSPEAAEALVGYMRSKFSDVRVIVPFAAMSAATMWTLAADSIVMGKHSQLGPIDPQISTATWSSPAAALREQFERAATECAERPERLSAWMPILSQFTPGLLEQCAQYEALAEELVREWLVAGQLSGDEAGAELAAKFFADAGNHHSHGRVISREQVRAYVPNVVDLESDDTFQDLVLSVFHATTHTLSATPVSKIIENHLGAAYIVMADPPPGPQAANFPPLRVPLA